MCLNHPLHPHGPPPLPHLWKSFLPWNLDLVPKTLGTADVDPSLVTPVAFLLGHMNP